MTKTNCRLLYLLVACLAVLILATPVTSFAQNSDAVASDFLNVYNTTTGKAIDLADAIPAESFDWRPAEGIRSVRESVLHVAGANYFFGSMIGAEVPEGINPQEMEKSGMSKEEAINALDQSVAFIRDALTNMNASDFETQIDFFGNKVTKRQAMFVLGDHAAEHLGQLIAYARMNNVVPPWSQ